MLAEIEKDAIAYKICLNDEYVKIADLKGEDKRLFVDGLKKLLNVIINDNITPNYYKSDYPLIDFANKHDINGFQFNILKYVIRYKEKNGLEDLKKAVMYANSSTDLGHKVEVEQSDIDRFCEANSINKKIVDNVLVCRYGNAIELINNLKSCL